MVKIINSNSFVFTQGKHTDDKSSKSKSITVPDDAMSIQDIVRKFSTGQRTTDQYREGTYNLQGVDDEHGSVDLEKLKDADLIDRKAFIDNLQSQVDSYLADREAKSKAEADAKRQADIEAEAAKMVAARKKSAPKKIANQGANAASE